jgi:hypothetical protein
MKNIAYNTHIWGHWIAKRMKFYDESSQIARKQFACDDSKTNRRRVMGCFSYKCKECGEPINSDSFSGEMVKLFLLKDGKVIEKMEGPYDSYGGVFTIEKDDHNNLIYNIDTTISWKMDWGDVCDIMDTDDKSEGVAAIHSACYRGVDPIDVSEFDANQGWGKMKPRFMSEIVKDKK